MTRQRCCCASNNVIQEKTMDTKVSKSPVGRPQGAQQCNALSTSHSFKRTCGCTPAICNMHAYCMPTHGPKIRNTVLMFGNVNIIAEMCSSLHPACCTVNNTLLKLSFISPFFCCASSLTMVANLPLNQYVAHSDVLPCEMRRFALRHSFLCDLNKHVFLLQLTDLCASLTTLCLRFLSNSSLLFSVLREKSLSFNLSFFFPSFCERNDTLRCTVTTFFYGNR